MVKCVTLYVSHNNNEKENGVICYMLCMLHAYTACVYDK